MADELSNIQKIPEPIRESVQQYVDLIKELAGDNALGLMLFGAVAAGAFDATRQTMRSVVILKTVDLGLLRRLAEHGLKLGKQHIAAPLIMTPDYIKESSDTFPLELIEIKQQHLTLFGDDYFSDLSFDSGHIRLQCERELKVVLMGLRQGLLAAAGREKVISALEVDVGEGLLRTLRGFLWLKGQTDGKPAAEVLKAVEEVTDRKLSGLRAALDVNGTHGWNEFNKLYEDVEALGKIVEGL